MRGLAVWALIKEHAATSSTRSLLLLVMPMVLLGAALNGLVFSVWAPVPVNYGWVLPMLVVPSLGHCGNLRSQGPGTWGASAGPEVAVNIGRSVHGGASHFSAAADLLQVSCHLEMCDTIRIGVRDFLWRGDRPFFGQPYPPELML